MATCRIYVERIRNEDMHFFEYQVCVACQFMESEGTEKSTVKA